MQFKPCPIVLPFFNVPLCPPQIKRSHVLKGKALPTFFLLRGRFFQLNPFSLAALLRDRLWSDAESYIFKNGTQKAVGFIRSPPFRQPTESFSFSFFFGTDTG